MSEIFCPYCGDRMTQVGPGGDCPNIMWMECLCCHMQGPEAVCENEQAALVKAEEMMRTAIENMKKRGTT